MPDYNYGGQIDPAVMDATGGVFQQRAMQAPGRPGMGGMPQAQPGVLRQRPVPGQPGFSAFMQQANPQAYAQSLAGQGMAQGHQFDVPQGGSDERVNALLAEFMRRQQMGAQQAPQTRPMMPPQMAMR